MVTVFGELAPRNKLSLQNWQGFLLILPFYVQKSYKIASAWLIVLGTVLFHTKTAVREKTYMEDAEIRHIKKEGLQKPRG